MVESHLGGPGSAPAGCTICGRRLDTIDRLAASIPGFAERVAPGRPLRYVVVQMLRTEHGLDPGTATDAVNAWIFNPGQVAVARKGLTGLWASSPIFANDIAAVRWQR